MTVKALTPVRTVNLVAPLAHKATDMHTTETGPSAGTRSGAAAPLIASRHTGAGLRQGGLNSAMVAPPTPGIATSTTATRTTTTRATKVVRLPSADPHLFQLLVQAYLDCRRTKRNSASVRQHQRNARKARNVRRARAANR